LSAEYRVTANQRCGAGSHRGRRDGDPGERRTRWLYAAVDPETNEFLHVRLFSTRKTQRTVSFSRERQQIMLVTHAAILADNAHHLKPALSRLGADFT